MKIWTQLNIDVDYSPSDPGISNWFCERTSFPKADLKPGQILRYKDPGGLFAAIRVLEVSPDKVVLGYGEKTYTLTPLDTSRSLDKDGRNYTNFYLNVWLQSQWIIEDSPAFYHYFLPKERIANFSEQDIKAFKASSSPAAKYIVGRWIYSVMPGENASEDFSKAQRLFEEAAASGVADAYEMLSRMYSRGENWEDRMDLEESTRLRDEALSRGSELAQLRYARNRIGGVLDAPEEPQKVLEEILQRTQDPNVSPEWYSVLGFVYETLGDKKKGEACYREGIAKGCVRCYTDLASLLMVQGREQECTRIMEEGMKAQSGFCYLLGYNLQEEEYEELDEHQKYRYTATMEERLKRGARLGEGLCAYFLGSNYFCGILGFPQSMEATAKWLVRGAALGDEKSCRLMADILESDNPSQEDLEDAASLRLKALRYGDGEQLEAVRKAYENGLLDNYRDEIEQYWLPEEDEDDGRWDAYV